MLVAALVGATVNWFFTLGSRPEVSKETEFLPTVIAKENETYVPVTLTLMEKLLFPQTVVSGEQDSSCDSDNGGEATSDLESNLRGDL